MAAMSASRTENNASLHSPFHCPCHSALMRGNCAGQAGLIWQAWRPRMAQCRFSTPVLAHLALAKGGLYRKALDGPREALDAILRGGLSECQFDSVELTRTVRKLARATREP